VSVELWGVVCIAPSGHRTVLSRFVSKSKEEAERGARKRDRIPNAKLLGYTHEVVPVVENPHARRPSELFTEVSAASAVERALTGANEESKSDG
jgi:hypothetical protein